MRKYFIKNVVAAFCMTILLNGLSTAETKEKNMTAQGEFNVEFTPQSEDSIDVGRMLISKKYSGDLEGEGKGQMLSKRTAVEGSAGYVAIEEFTGSVGGKKGSFILQHTGLMKRGSPSLDVTVIPDSGTGELAGISGKMAIAMVEGKHLYTFEYSLDNQ